MFLPRLFRYRAKSHFYTHSLERTINQLRNMSYGNKAAERLAGKTALITGVSSGIGKATAFELASAAGGNIRLIITARRVDRLEETKKELEKEYPSIGVLPLKLDVSDHKNIPKFVADLPKEWSDVDILINNA